MPPDPPLAIAPFVDAGWVGQQSGLVLADLRWSLDGSVGYDSYLAGHLPGAIFVDLDTVAAGPPSTAEGRHPLPSPAAFAQALGDLGIDEDVTVVAYDQAGGAIAARLVWMLRVTGQSAAVLEGGLAAWPGDLEDGPVTLPAVTRTARPWPADRIADADLTAMVAAGQDGVVLDARDAARYRGDQEPVDARPGHVPGAVNRPFADNLTAGGTLRPHADLQAHYAEVGALEADEVVAYCGSGVTACHDLLVLEHLGVSGRLYAGSWSAWAADPAREAATGPGDVER